MNAFSTIPFELVHGRNPERVIHGRATIPSNRTTVPFVLMIHGHRGFMDWAFLPELARRLGEVGLATVAFNMSGSGIGPDLVGFTELSSFAQNTYTRELEDIDRVRDEVDRGAFEGLDPKRAAIFGHSRGGGMGLLHAAQRGDYRALCLWAPMHRVALFGPESMRSFEERGFIESPLASGQSLRLDRAVIDDARENAEELDIRAACARIHAPILLVYGARDRLLAVGGRKALEEALVSSKPEVLVVEGGGHALGARHPLRTVPAALEQGLEKSVDWLAGQLI